MGYWCAEYKGGVSGRCVGEMCDLGVRLEILLCRCPGDISMVQIIFPWGSRRVCMCYRTTATSAAVLSRVLPGVEHHGDRQNVNGSRSAKRKVWRCAHSHATHDSLGIYSVTSKQCCTLDLNEALGRRTGNQSIHVKLQSDHLVKVRW